MTDPTNPFETEYARELISEIASNKYSDSVFWTNEIAFECVLTNDDDDGGGYDDECCYEVWASACLYDSMLNGTPYSYLCRGYEEVFENAVKRLEKDIFKKKFLSQKPVHDLSKILQNAVDALDVIMGINSDSELAEKMKASGLSKEFEAGITDLRNRLANHINK